MRLDTPFTITGTVIKGEEVGRTIGFPTANLNVIPSKNDLAPGVYAGHCWIKGEQPHVLTAQFDCLVYYGPRYIFGEKNNNFEVYIYEFDQDIYGKQLKVKLTHFLRTPKDVDTTKELQQMLIKDKQDGVELLS